MHRKQKKPFRKKHRGLNHDIKTIQPFPAMTPVKREKKINGFSFSFSHPTAVQEAEFSERRKHNRISMVASLGISLEGGFHLRGYAVNVSYGGISLYTQKPLFPGTPIQIKIAFIDFNGRDVFDTISGSVVWCQPVGEWFGMGIKFKFVDPIQHPHLVGYLVRGDRSKDPQQE